MAQPSAVIVGAGLGGLTAALALHRVGWHVQVVERAPSLEPVGAAISLWPNALRALDAIGVGAGVRAHARLTGAGGVRRPDGRWLARSDITSAVLHRYGEPLVMLRRSELVALLVDALPPGTVETGTTVTGLASPDGPVTLRTDRGDLGADLVVAADGIRSTLRAALFPDHPRPRYVGYQAWRMIVPAVDDTTGAFETWGRGGARFAVVPMDADFWYCYATLVLPAGQADPDPAAELVARFGTWHAPIPEVLARIKPGSLLRQDVEELGTALPTMHAGRVAFVGDAAHAMTPDLGQGGCMAIEDAVVLGSTLRDAPVPEALIRFTSSRLPRTTTVATRSRRTSRLYEAPYPVQILAARLMALLPDAVAVRGLDSIVGWRPPSPTR
ncbi:MAG TPA: FAD-dependent monooxygenase [Micromonosporaceae bacterium]